MMKGLKSFNLASIFACALFVGCGSGSPTPVNKPVGAGGVSGANPQDKVDAEANEKAAGLGKKAK